MPLPRLQPQGVSLDDFGKDVGQVVKFLSALEAVAPGRTVAEAVAELEHAAQSQLALELLARAMGGK